MLAQLSSPSLSTAQLSIGTSQSGKLHGRRFRICSLSVTEGLSCQVVGVVLPSDRKPRRVAMSSSKAECPLQGHEGRTPPKLQCMALLRSWKIVGKPEVREPETMCSVQNCPSAFDFGGSNPLQITEDVTVLLQLQDTQDGVMGSCKVFGASRYSNR